MTHKNKIIVMGGLCLIFIVGISLLRTESKSSEMNIDGNDFYIHHGLIIQDYDTLHDVIYASKGAAIYASSDLGKTFKEYYTLPMSLDMPFFVSRFRVIRDITGFHEVIEMKIVGDGHHLITYGSDIYTWSSQNGLQRSNHRMRQLGGNKYLLAQSIAQTPDGTLYYGEYGRNTEKRSVAIYYSSDSGTTWTMDYTFPENTIRHIHTITYNPFDSSLWVGTGDIDRDIFLGTYSEGQYYPIMEGSQVYRVVSLLFDDSTVYWGSDAPDIDTNYIFSFNRTNNHLDTLGSVNGPVYYSYKALNGELFFGTAHETRGIGMHDDSVSIYSLRNNTLEKKLSLKRNLSQKRHAIIRFPKTNGADFISFSAHNIDLGGAVLFVAKGR